MATMKRKELDKIIRNHQHWLKQDCKGWETMKANLSGANLTGANLSEADLRKADLFSAHLLLVELRKADLSGANMSGANLREADLSEANLSGVNLTGANLYEADLSGANLHETNMEYADIYTTSYDEKETIRKGIVLLKPIKGYKKTAEGVIITAEIPAGAIVFSINGEKCRTNMATITNMAGHKLLHSQYDPGFTYKIGKKIIIPDFDTRYNVECGPGFHFFRTKKEAENF